MVHVDEIREPRVEYRADAVAHDPLRVVVVLRRPVLPFRAREEVTRTHTEGADVILGKWKGGRTGEIRAVRPDSDYGVLVFRAGGKVDVAAKIDDSYRPLVAEIVKPAEAEAERVRVLALAEAEKMRIQAEAAASNDRVALDRMLIDQLPQIVREAAKGLAGANVTVLNGSDGLSEMAAGLVKQSMPVGFSTLPPAPTVGLGLLHAVPVGR